MNKNLKTILVYVGGLGGLVLISIMMTGQFEADIAPLPTSTPTTRPTPTAGPTEVANPGCQPTPGGRTYGYLPGAPLTTTLAPPELPGQRLVISGTVYAADCTTPLANALVEVWQADANGRYDRSAPFRLRAQMRTDIEGRYEFTTIRPGHYGTEDIVRPAHIHYQVTYPDHDPLGTRLLFADDPYLPSSYSLASPLVISLTQSLEKEVVVLQGIFDIVMPVAPLTSTIQSAKDDEL